MTNSVDLSIYQTKLSFKLWLGIEVPKIVPPLCVGSVETKLHTGRLPSSTQQVSSVAFGATVGWQIQWTSASIRQKLSFKLWLGIEVPKIAPPLCVGSVETKLHTGRLPSSTQQVSSVAFGAAVGWQIQWTSASIRQNCHLKSRLQNIYCPPIGTSWLPNGCAKTYQFSRCSHPAPWKIHEPRPRCAIANGKK